jgi:hypothetical protein
MANWLKHDVDVYLRDFGEDVIVIETGQSPRTIKALVDRLPPGIGRDGSKLDARITIEVANDPVKGIASDVATSGKLRVRVATRIGGVAEPEGRMIVIPESDGDWQDAGMITLGLK